MEGVACEHMLYGNQHGMSDGDDGAVFAAAGNQPPILGIEIRILVLGSNGALDNGGLERSIF